MRISVFGCGYLGAVHAACMTRLGHDVVGVDVVADHVAALSRGDPAAAGRYADAGYAAFWRAIGAP